MATTTTKDTASGSGSGTTSMPNAVLLSRESSEEGGDSSAVPTMAVWFEKYEYSVLFGDFLAGWSYVTVSRFASMEEVNRKIKIALDPQDEYERFGVVLYSGFFEYAKSLCCGVIDLMDVCGCCRLMYFLCCCCCGHDATRNNELSLLDPSVEGNAETVFVTNKMHLRVYLPRFKRGVHDIGVFGYDTMRIGSQYLTTSPEITSAFDSDEEAIHNLVATLHGNMDASYELISPGEALGQEVDIFAPLRTYADQLVVDELAAGRQPTSDFKVSLQLHELAAFVGQSAADKMASIFTLDGGHIDDIILRRCSVDNQFIPFHKDICLKTMQVALNNCSEYDGGRLVYATRNKLIAPIRSTGTITIHRNDIIHGVSALSRGVRYGLFFLERANKNRSSIYPAYNSSWDGGLKSEGMIMNR